MQRSNTKLKGLKITTFKGHSIKTYERRPFPFLHRVCVCVLVRSARVHGLSSPCQRCPDRLLTRTALFFPHFHYWSEVLASSSSLDWMKMAGCNIGEKGRKSAIQIEMTFYYKLWFCWWFYFKIKAVLSWLWHFNVVARPTIINRPLTHKDVFTNIELWWSWMLML